MHWPLWCNWNSIENKIQPTTNSLYLTSLNLVPHVVRFTLSRTTNFRLFQTERVCRQQFQVWWKQKKVPKIGRKHCGKRRTCSLQAISLFFHSVFKRLGLQTCENQGLFGKGLTLGCWFNSRWTKEFLLLSSKVLDSWTGGSIFEPQWILWAFWGTVLSQDILEP